ncbi:MAG: hypothetical protein OEY52_16180 [Gammaproteobacteria bacterium]|nr:hypothetical protein [Gammaproteobacteria bacterium]
MNRIKQLSYLILLTSLSFTAASQDISAMKNMMQQEMMASCQDRAFLSCVGISSNKCTKSGRKAISSCDHLFPKSMAAMSANNGMAMEAFGECINKTMLKHTGVPSNRLDACDSMADNSPAGGQPEMDPEQMMAMMGTMLKQHADATGTSGVTLPLYKNAVVKAHFANGEMANTFDDIKPIPALTMESPDGINKIASFYRGKLKGFREYKMLGGVVFLKNGPKKFDRIKDMKKYMTTPHVEIMPTPGVSNTSIQIAYEK